MGDYVLLTDATVDLPDDILKKLDINVIPMAFDIDGQTYFHYPDEREMSCKDFYRKLRDGAMPTTAQVTPFMFEEEFKKYLAEGKDVLCVTFSSGLSGTSHSALVASQNIAKKYPDRKITCIDSLCASAGLGILIFNAAMKRSEGMDMDALAQWIADNKFNARHWFAVEDLNHLKRGGRVTAVSAALGTALKIKPVLTIDHDGKLVVEAKVRGFNKAVSFLIDKVKEEGIDTAEQTLVIGHADSEDVALKIKQKLLDEKLARDVIITNIGPVIGTHVGPGMVAVTFMGRDE